MALAGTLELQITAGLARLQQDMDRAKQITSTGADVMKKVLAGIGVGISVAGFTGLIKSVAAAGDKLHDLSKISGLTVEQLGGLNKIAKLNGTTLDQVSKAVGLMSKNMYAGADAFKTLGIQTRESDGSMRSANAVLLDVADRFSRMNNGVEKSALSMKIFGKSGRELIPMLSEGRAAIEAATESYSKNSAMTTRAAAESDRFGDQLVVLGERTTAIKTRFVVDLLPSINDIISAFLRATDGASKFTGITNVLNPLLKGLAISAGTVFFAFDNVARSIGAAAAQAVALAKFDYSRYLEIGRELSRLNTEADKTYNDFIDTVINGENVIDENNKELKEMVVLQEQIGDATGKSTGKTKAYNVEVYKLKELGKQLAGAKDIEYQKLKRHESALDEARQLTEQTRTAQEKYNAAIQKYNSLKPYLTADTYSRAVANATNELERSRSELDKVDEANKNLRDNWRHAWTNMEQTGRMAFTQFAAHGVSSIESIGNALKLAVFDLLYHLTARRWIINIGTSLESTMLGAAGATAATAGGGGALSVANLGVGALNLVKGGFGVPSLLGRGVSALGGAIGSGTLSAFGSGMMGGASTAAFSAAGGAGTAFIGGPGTAIGGSGLGGAASMGASMAAMAGPAIVAFAVDQIFRLLAGDKLIGGGVGKALNYVPILGPLLNAMFGRGPLKQKETTLSGVIGTEGFESGMLNARFKAQGGWFRSDKTDFARVDAITGDIWTDNQKQLGEFAKSMSKASKGIFSAFNDAAKESSKIINATADNLGLSTEAMKDFEYQLKLVSEKGKNLTEEQIAEEIGKMSEAMAEKFIPNIQELTNASESAIEAISRLNAEFTATEQAARVLGMSLSDAKVYVQGMGFELRTAFTDAAGGVESFASKIAFVGDNFLTAEQRFAMGIETLNSQLTKANVPLDTTKESFYQLLRVAAAAGDAVKFSGLLDIAPLFIEIKNSINTVTENTVTEFKNSINTVTESIISAASANAVDAKNVLSGVWTAEENRLKTLISQFKGLSDSLKTFKNSLLQGSLSTLDPERKYDFARSQFQSIAARARLGDADAASQLQSASEAFLTASQGYYASSGQYESDFQSVMESVSLTVDVADRQEILLKNQLDKQTEQVRVLLNINENIMTLADAMVNATKANASMFGTQPSGARFDYTSGNVASSSGQQLGNVAALRAEGLAQIEAGNAIGVYRYAASNGITLSDANAILGFTPGTAEKWADDNKLPKFAQGVNKVPRDMLSMVHKGEEIRPYKQVEADRSAQNKMISELQALVRLQAAANKALIDKLDSIDSSSKDSARTQRRNAA